jgi:predicted lactoylglutathione lyase
LSSTGFDLQKKFDAHHADDGGAGDRGRPGIFRDLDGHLWEIIHNPANT